MQVNKYIPHYQRIPQKFDKKDFKMFEYGPDESQSEDQYKKIKEFIEDFDKVLIDTLMVDRETKYNTLYRNEHITTQMEELTVNESGMVENNQDLKSVKVKSKH